MKPTDEQQRRLWEWCDVKFKIVGRCDRRWSAPEGEPWYPGQPDLTLDNLVKWAVPRLESYEIDMTLVPNGKGRAVVRIGHYEPVDDISLRDALFWAIWKVAEKVPSE